MGIDHLNEAMWRSLEAQAGVETKVATVTDVVIPIAPTAGAMQIQNVNGRFAAWRQNQDRTGRTTIQTAIIPSRIPQVIR